MVTKLCSFARRGAWRRVGFAVLACAAAMGAMTAPAAAWWRGGVWFGGPVVVAPPLFYPPVVYPPPVYYPPPPPVWYTPPPARIAAPPPPVGPSGQSCYAGPYVCPMDHPTAPGNACYCLGNNRTQVWGRAS